ncbi:MAG: histidine kinase [Candidatus Marinimicrobia bacterium]|jgi:sensor histidine kinase YesM|nr:histidine kinase [Candidatus Neomarinimicrobiota bacterium]MBT4130064.1 histidine kinase [Candidatus Neomarinimicrobiota bacterium]MBT4295051.1 histidine kinase [Candidatus Neomarinimicrobiota bacterium]MBT4419877.1 histidine kinase [Candidatus Neomarinimicrobiota bacterium]MBT4994003.1 histidine kinase [Candidatus Neomarinimicrobiota bacterium]
MNRKWIEPLLLLILFGLIYFTPIGMAKLPVFSGQFNNLDGSLYSVRLMDVVISAFLILFASRYLIPNQLDRRSILKIVIAFGTVLLACSVIEYGWDALTLRVFNLPTAAGEVSDKMLLYTRRETLNLTILSGNLIVLTAGIFYGLARDRNSQIRRHERLELKNLEAEVKYLRSQLNPHFLFNSLNNIYAITQRNDDQEGSDALLRLSGLMRYMLYDSAGDSIGLHQEIEHLQNFKDLMLLKYKRDDPPFVDIQIEGEPENFRVAPLILLPFVENAFKHGIDNHGKGYIKMKLVAARDVIEFSINNSRFPDRVASQEHKGIGLENVTRRLEHLYPEKHTLEISMTEEEYQVLMRISL